jgi:hypothetical protein
VYFADPCKLGDLPKYFQNLALAQASDFELLVGALNRSLQHLLT